MAVEVGDWVAYSDSFILETSTTAAGARDMTSRRGQVTAVFDDGKLCNVDWGDVILQIATDSPSIVVSDAPTIGRGANEVEPEAESGFRPR